MAFEVTAFAPQYEHVAAKQVGAFLGGAADVGAGLLGLGARGVVETGKKLGKVGLHTIQATAEATIAAAGGSSLLKTLLSKDSEGRKVRSNEKFAVKAGGVVVRALMEAAMPTLTSGWQRDLVREETYDSKRRTDRSWSSSREYFDSTRYDSGPIRKGLSALYDIGTAAAGITYGVTTGDWLGAVVGRQALTIPGRVLANTAGHVAMKVPTYMEVPRI